MAIEATVQFPADLVANWPLPQDAISEGDDQIRACKTSIAGAWPAIAGAVTVDEADINATVGCGNHPAGTINERLERAEEGQSLSSQVVWISRHVDGKIHVYPENGSHFWGARIQGATPLYALAYSLDGGVTWLDADRILDAQGNAVIMKGASLMINDLDTTINVRIGEYDVNNVGGGGAEVPADSVDISGGGISCDVMAIGDGTNEAQPVYTFSNLKSGTTMLIANSNCSHWFECHIRNAAPNTAIWHKHPQLVGGEPRTWIATQRYTDRAGNAVLMLNSHVWFESAETVPGEIYQVAVAVSAAEAALDTTVKGSVYTEFTGAAVPDCGF